MQIEIFASSGEITAAARSSIDLYSNWTIEILRVNCKYLIEMRSLWAIGCKVGLNARSAAA
jgi:hypothetical protein